MVLTPSRMPAFAPMIANGTLNASPVARTCLSSALLRSSVMTLQIAVFAERDDNEIFCDELPTTRIETNCSARRTTLKTFDQLKFPRFW